MLTDPNCWQIIRNPRSGAGKGVRDWPKIQKLLHEKNISFQEHSTDHQAHAIQIVKEIAFRGGRKFCAVGGDGTVNEVANGIMNSGFDSREFEIAVIPVGTGNDWGRTLGIPGNYEGAVQTLAGNGRFVQDVGTLHFYENGEKQVRYFVNIAGMGYDGFVGKEINDLKKQGKGGQMAYLRGVISGLRKYQPSEVTYSVEGKSITERVFTMAMGVCRFNGGAMKPLPDAIPDDGNLEIMMVHNVPKWLIVLLTPALYRGKHIRNKHVFMYRSPAISLKAPEECLFECDGEVIGGGNVEMGIIPLALKVVVDPNLAPKPSK